jgi:hypothetical protein
MRSLAFWFAVLPPKARFAFLVACALLVYGMTR